MFTGFPKMFGTKSDQSFRKKLEKVKRTQIENIRRDDTIILLLGQSGSGKSTFISKILGCDVGVGHLNLGPSTETINPIRLTLPKSQQHCGDLILVDTPGIEADEQSQAQVMIRRWCKDIRKHGLVISDFLYFRKLQRVVPSISAGARLLLRELCPEQTPEEVLLVLSMEKPDGKQKMKPASQQKSTIVEEWRARPGIKPIEFSGTVDSALDIIRTLVPLTPDPRSKDMIIAVIGPTGSGKSELISKITNGSVEIGHNLQSCTKSVNPIRVKELTPSEAQKIFVDTPGFDDTDLSEVDILKMILEWRNKSYDDIQLSGLLYLHRITDNRLGGTPLRNLGMFQKLLGKDTLRNIVLVTTMWDEVDPETGEQREKDLKSNYWAGMMALGSRTHRFHRTEASALDILNSLIDASMCD